MGVECYLPPELVARIAHFADIDTRRVMLFPPRKLKLAQYQWLDDFLREKESCVFENVGMDYRSVFLMNRRGTCIYWFYFNYDYFEYMIVKTKCVQNSRYIDGCLLWNPAEDECGSTMFVYRAFDGVPEIAYRIKSRGLFAYITDSNLKKLHKDKFVVEE
jgi:hypothetical protein